MKTTRSVLFLAIVLALTTAAGCAVTPQDRWYQQRETLNTANRIYLAHTPVMTDEQVVYYGELLQTARGDLADATSSLPEGGSSGDTTLAVVESSLARISAMERQGTPATSPAPEDTPNDTR